MSTATDSDESIAQAVCLGDTDAFAELVNRYEPKLRRYARRFLARDDAIDDLVQDVFIKVYTNLQSFNTTQRFSPWVYRIAHNTFVNEIRRQQRWQFDWFAADTVLPQLSAPETSDAETLATELNEEVASVLRELPPKYREVIVLYYFESLTYQEIADVLKIPPATVGARLSRGRTKLKQLCEERNIAYE